MSVDAHRDLRTVVIHKFLHDFGMHAVGGKQPQIGMAKLVQAPAFESVVCTILCPSAAECARQDSLAIMAEDDGGDLVLHDITFTELAA